MDVMEGFESEQSTVELDQFWSVEKFEEARTLLVWFPGIQPLSKASPCHNDNHADAGVSEPSFQALYFCP